MISRGLKQKKQKYCKGEILQNWQLKSEANVKGWGGSASVSASLATKFKKSDLGGIEIWEKYLIMKFYSKQFWIYFSILYYM